MRPIQPSWRCFIMCALFWMGMDVGRMLSTAQAADGRIAIRVVDEAGEVTPARGWVDADTQRLFRPVSPETATPYAQDQSFSCDGWFTMIVPAGKVSVHIEKGKEFAPVDVNIEVPADETVEQTIRITRWIDMPAGGWYSADLHVHLGFDDPRVLKQLAQADDVHLVPSFTYWLRGRGETWNSRWPDESYLQPIVVDRRHLVTRNNIEIERINRDAAPGGTIGATFLFNLQQPVTAASYGEFFPTDAELCMIARKQSPTAVFDSDKPSWAETVIGAALGMLDTVQVCHNHYYRSSTGPGGYGMIGPLSPEESNAAVGDGLFHRTNALYYRLLNCGFRLGVSGGSAIGVKAMPTGHHRAYAHIDGPLTAESMWAAIKAGRSFATTGPMLRLSANDQPIASTISLDSNNPSPVHIQTSVQAIEALEAIEIVHNGRVVASQDLQSVTLDPVLQSELKLSLAVSRSGWIASRVLYRAADGLLRQAHTSPIYVVVDDQPTAFAEDARYMLRWIDQLEQIATQQTERYPDAVTQLAVLKTYAAARARYEMIVEAAEGHWHDK